MKRAAAKTKSSAAISSASPPSPTEVARRLRNAMSSGAPQDAESLLKQLVALVDEANKAMALERPDERDSPKDRLLGILMARFDYLQAHRAAYLDIFAALQQAPQKNMSLSVRLLPALHDAMAKALAQAKIEPQFLPQFAPFAALQAAGLLAVYGWAAKAWQKDDKADLPATMRALDQALSRAEWLMRRVAGKPVS